MSERSYRGNLLGRRYAAPLTDEDYKILHGHGAGVRAFYGRADRADAEMIFANVDSAGLTRAPKEETETDRHNRLRNGPVRTGSSDSAVSVGSVAR